MCGISGFIRKEGMDEKRRGLVRRLNDSLTHRGPDGTGEYHDAYLALAMRRLSIIDLATGWQPLYNEDQSLVLIANGEVYNFIEMREQLKSRGHRFRTGSDCETILHLYEEYGLECVQHLRGMYAFAIWDIKQQQLLLVRDRMGEKPLYLAESEGQLVFASEMKALLQAGIVPFKLNPASVHLYFHYGYLPEPDTMISGVRKLPAGHLLVINVKDWSLSERCYWRMEDAPPLDGDPAHIIREELNRVSELIIRSDVAVGVALSGGLDSSVIAALSARKYPGAMHAFTVGYPGNSRNDERADARRLAEHLKMPFHEIELKTEDVVAGFPEMVRCRDDPIADIAGSGYLAIMREARKSNVPVMLMGQGGDELFWGYPWVRNAVRASERKARQRETGTMRLADYLHFDRPPLSYTAAIRWIKSVAGVLSGIDQYRRDSRSPQEQFVFYDCEPGFLAAMHRLRWAYTTSFARGVAEVRPLQRFFMELPWPNIDVAITRMICQTYLLENGIAQGDRLSMANSVELRLPLVDYRLVETVIGLRKAQTDKDLPAKHWFIEATQGVLPNYVSERPKRGFSPPWREWYRELFTAYGEDLIDGYLVQAGVLDGDSAKRLARGIEFPRTPMPLAFPAITLEIWSRQMEGEACRNAGVAGGSIHAGRSVAAQ
jgi:asparagine synthase (glutamine-hydrolysing)